MPKCPKCGVEINYLRCFASVEAEYHFTIDEGGFENYQDAGNIIPINGEEDFECPECSRTLFTDMEEAKKFLLDK